MDKSQLHRLGRVKTTELVNGVGSRGDSEYNKEFTTNQICLLPQPDVWVLGKEKLKIRKEKQTKKAVS